MIKEFDAMELRDIGEGFLEATNGVLSYWSGAERRLAAKIIRELECRGYWIVCESEVSDKK